MPWHPRCAISCAAAIASSENCIHKDLPDNVAKTGVLRRLPNESVNKSTLAEHISCNCAFSIAVFVTAIDGFFEGCETCGLY